MKLSTYNVIYIILAFFKYSIGTYNWPVWPSLSGQYRKCDTIEDNNIVAADPIIDEWFFDFSWWERGSAASITYFLGNCVIIFST